MNRQYSSEENNFYGEKDSSSLRPSHNEQPIKLDWASRGNKSSRQMDYILREDEEIFREHQQQMEKKQTFDFSNLKNVDLKITFQGRDLDDTYEYHRFEEIPYLEDFLKGNMKKMKFSLMTPIQKAVMPYMFKGHDVMGCSQTGSGKTVAFLLPIVNKMIKEGHSDKLTDYVARPVALVLVPTRELADQIYKEARKLIHKTGINIIKVYGGVSNMHQSRELKNGCDILVATPGRLLDFLRSRDISLSHVKYLSLDEADRMLDMGFEPQLKSIIYDFDLRDKAQRQNLMFSATFEPEVKGIARKFMNEFYFVHTNTEMKANQNVTQKVYYAKESEKVLQLHKILQTIQVFLDTKRGVENLNAFLDKSNYNVIAIHGDKKQWQRQDAIKKFTSGEVPILIATDVASRGLDFPKVSYVFNFDMPSNIDDYIHRIGRTGRCGDKGVAISFVNENNKNIVKALYRLLRELNQEVPEFLEKLNTECANYHFDNKRRFNGGSNDFMNKRRDDNRPSWRDGNNTRPSHSYSDRNAPHYGQSQSNGWDNKPVATSSGWDNRPVPTNSGWDNRPVATTSGWDNKPIPTSSGWDNKPMTSNFPQTNSVIQAQPVYFPNPNFIQPLPSNPVNYDRNSKFSSNPYVPSQFFNGASNFPTNPPSTHQIQPRFDNPSSNNREEERKSSHQSSSYHSHSRSSYHSERRRSRSRDRDRSRERDRHRDRDYDRRRDDDHKKSDWRNDDDRRRSRGDDRR